MQFRPGTPLAMAFESLGRLRERWPGGGFSWDNRLQCVASSIHIDLVREGRAAAALALPFEWNMRNIMNAPAPVREMAEQTGGIRPDQLLFSGEPFGLNIVYGLWWPWGDDVTISFRVGLAGPAVVRDDVQSKFRDLFGAEL
ncbi:MAG TPA: hypothetical protein VKZ49_13100 [Polyangiaceae bacterium]|nr:hypothetical protein [Polyangiaceae bacterium]